MKKLVIALTLTFALLLTFAGVFASAKTLESARADNVFVYAADAEGRSVLLKVVPLAELAKLAHGQSSGDNYYISSTDNYPTTQYCEARGITVPELLDYVKRVTTVAGASGLTFAGGDTIRLMATDSYGNYNRVWTARDLYETPRYYFEGLFDAKSGWKSAWEIAGDDASKFGVTLGEYNAKYAASDPYYADKRAVFEGGVRTVPILAVQSFSGRTTADALVASTEIGIADYIAKNGGIVAGSLKNALTDDVALRLALPMTEADLMAAHRTAFDNFKWTYNLKFGPTISPLTSLGTVAEPVANVTVSGDTLTISLSCATPGATLYYSFDGAPQVPYTKPVTVDISGKNLAAEPITFYATAVREGWDDAGIVTFKYPGLAPAFRTQYSALAGQPVTFAAADGVSAQTWTEWANKLTFITIKAPSSGGYTRIDKSKYRIDRETVALDASLFAETGSYSFVFHASGYADKAASLTIKKPAPDALPPKTARLGMPLAFKFTDNDFQNGVSLYVSPVGGEPVMVATSWLDRAVAGRVTLKAAYFDSPGCAITAAGEYKFSFVNSRYEPGTVDIQLTVDNGQLSILDDVAADAWYNDAARYVLGAGLFDLANADEFAPDAPMTRTMLAEALYRLAGSPGITAAPPFADAAAPSVTWAYEAGIVNGVGGNRFAPDASITREQLAAMFWRYAKYAGADVSAAGDLLKFTDAGKIADWARDSVRWAVGAGIVNGMGDGTVAPQGTATRAQTAQILLNYTG